MSVFKISCAATGLLFSSMAFSTTWDFMAEHAKNSVPVERDQYVVVVDRNPDVQAVGVLELKTDGSSVWHVQDKTSTGNDARKGYFTTPTGVFRALAGGSYRAQGTRNANGVRGLGTKGMRVWDFGWQPTLKKGDIHDIRLQMHATDPDVLEKRLGAIASKGCVRVSTAMNRFIDENGVLDYPWHAYMDKYGYQLAPAQRKEPSSKAGLYMVVVDSSEVRKELASQENH